MNIDTLRKGRDGICLFIITLMVSACTPPQGESISPKPGDVSGGSSHTEIMNALYNDIRTPADFYREAQPSDGFYTISHVKNTDLLQPADRAGVTVYELSTDDFSEALDWSETAATYQGSYRPLVDSSESDFYLQFTRADASDPELIHLSRVFKQSVIDRSGVDRAQDSGYQGRIALPALNAGSVKTLIEYLWTFSFNNNYGNAVLDATTDETADAYIYIMHEAKLIPSNSAGCDTIEVYETRHEVDKATGMIWKSLQLDHTFQSRVVYGEPTVCKDTLGDLIAQ